MKTHLIKLVITITAAIFFSLLGAPAATFTVTPNLVSNGINKDCPITAGTAATDVMVIITYPQ